MPITEKFIIVNDKTGQMHLLDYPGDQTGSPANVYNCLCDVYFDKEIIKDGINLDEIDYELLKQTQKQKSETIKKKIQRKKDEIPVSYKLKPTGNSIPSFFKKLTDNEKYVKTLNDTKYYSIKKSLIDKYGHVRYNSKILDLICKKFKSTKQHKEGINTPKGATYKNTLGSKMFNIFIKNCYNPITKEYDEALINKYKNMTKRPSKEKNYEGFYLYNIINSKNNLVNTYKLRAKNIAKNTMTVQGNMMVHTGTKDISRINIEGKKLREIKDGDIIHLSTFQSTSINESVTHKFANEGHPPTIIHIGLPDGSSWIPILKNSSKPWKQEGLIPMEYSMKKVGKTD